MSEVSIATLLNESNRPAPSDDVQVRTILVPLEKIIVPPDRSRRVYNNIRELADSIKAIGLMHPLFCVENADQTYTLIAGGRRYRALMSLGWKMIPIRLGAEFTPLERVVAELAENHDREKLTAVEELDNLRRIDEVKRQIYGDGGKGSGDGWTLAKTAEFTKQSPRSAKDKLEAAKIIDKRPDIREMVKDLPMMAAIRKTNEIIETEKLHKQHQNQELKLVSDLRQGDARELIKTVADNTVDLLINDPPFGMNELQDSVGDTFDASANYTAFLKETDNLSFDDSISLLKTLIPEYYRVMKPSAHGYIFSSMELYREFLFEELQRCGFDISLAPVIWYKGRATTNFNGTNFPSSYEVIAFFRKPDEKGWPTRQLTNTKLHNVLTYSPVSPQKKVHRFQKPQELLCALIETSSRIGELVFDPTAGSGATVKAARTLKRGVIGFELDPDNFVRAQAFLAMK